MTPERYQQVEARYHAALELPPELRAGWLAQACAGDEDLLREVTSLLDAHSEAGNFIVQPAMQVAAELLAQEHVQTTAGRRIGPYQILSLLGAGGMGEVHLAQDVRLQRKVALKLLPAQWSKDADRVRRFLKEAQAASALNHPNIITIYEVGQTDEVDGAPFIASEYVDGQTLRQLGSQPLPLTQALDVTAQIATALAAAHEAGIIHRDIKPENVMVRRDGLVKVLDFGLAKPTTPLPALLEGHKTLEGQNANSTAPGVILGTLRYMSPEQARGLRVDARSDIFSLGVVLYELLTGSLPFTGRTSSDVLAALLTATPPPLPEVYPVELQRIVSQALGKEPEARYQSAAVLLADLKRLKQAWERQDEWADGNATNALTPGLIATAGARSGQTHSQSQASSTKELLLSGIRQHRRSVVVTALVLLAVLSGLGYGVWRLYKLSRQATAFQEMKLTKLLSTSKIDSAENALSPDGKYLAYILAEGEQRSLWVMHIPTRRPLQIATVTAPSLEYPAFSPDGNYVYYVVRDKQTLTRLYRVAVLGGTPVQVLDNIDSRVTFAPAGDRFAYLSEDRRTLYLANQDGSHSQALAVNQTDVRWSYPAWSPDGGVIVCAARPKPPAPAFLISVNTSDGALKTFGATPWAGLTGLAWLPKGNGLLLSAADNETKRYQLWTVSYPDGQAQRVSNDLSVYIGVSSAGQTSQFAFLRGTSVSNLWLVPRNAPSQARQVSFDVESKEGIYGVAWTPDEQLIYTNETLSGQGELWLLNLRDGQRRPLEGNAGNNQYPVISPDGKTLVFVSTRSGRAALWRMDWPGGKPVLLVEPSGFPLYPQFSSDGQWVFFSMVADKEQRLWKVPSTGGTVVPVGADKTLTQTLSPDGRYLAQALVESANTPVRLALLPLTSDAPTRWLEFPGWAVVGMMRWTTDGRGLTLIDKRGGGHNLANLMLDGSPVKALTEFPSGTIYYFDWSRDGKWLALARGDNHYDLVLLSDFKF